MIFDMMAYIITRDMDNDCMVGVLLMLLTGNNNHEVYTTGQ